MRTQLKHTVKMPSYALPYLINADNSGLEEEDIKLIDKFMSRYYKIADDNDWNVIINPKEDYASFEPFPAFGLACDCIETDIIILG